MKIVLSRKGFDAGQGRRASPILPDGSTLSLPIPAPEKYPDSPTRYRDVRWRDSSLAPIVECLTNKCIRGDDKCHLDPDIRADALQRRPEWRPTFGQVDGAQTELKNHGIRCGDLFLFFGWFRRVEEKGGRWRYVPNAPDVHRVFGWLQVSDIVCIGADTAAAVKRRPWLHAHPHVNGSWPRTNTIYVATPKLCIDGTEIDVDGGGVFRTTNGCQQDQHQLTRPGEPRSHWKLPWEMGVAWLKPRRPNNLTKEGPWVHVAVAGRGQEFVFEGTPRVIDWVHELFKQQRGNLK